MQRRHFIQGVGSGVALVCLGCLAACSKSSPASPSGSSSGGSSSFSLDLSSQLTQVGDYLLKNGAIVARIASGNTPSAFAAVQSNCTHQGFPLIYDGNSQEFHCNNHGSNFTTAGAVVNGPATVALQVFKVSVSGSTLTVTL